MTIEPNDVSNFGNVQPAPYQAPMPQPAPQLNYTLSVTYKSGWPGLFGGDNQTKALDRALRELNSRGHRVAAAVVDRWSIWKRLGMILLALVSLGFYVRVPNFILITEPIR